MNPQTPDTPVIVSHRYRIKPNCTQCKACVPVCPTDAIFQGMNQLVIDTDACVGCAMCAKICPENAVAEVSHAV